MTILPPAENRSIPKEPGESLHSRLSTIVISSPWVVTAFTGSIVVALVLGLGLLSHVHYNDENFYNRLIRYYAGQNILTPMHDSANQPIALGPTFFIAHRLWSGIFGPGEFQARAFSLTLMLAASAFWTSIAIRLYRAAPSALIAAFWILPFHAVFAICSLAEPFMLALLLASMRLWMSAVDRIANRTDKSPPLLFCLSGLLFGVAINCKVPLLPIAMAMALFGALRIRNVWSAVGPFIAIMTQIPFWISWGNVFPPGQRHGMMPQFAHMSGLYADTAIHLLTVCGTVIWPAFRFERKSPSAWITLAAGAALWFALGPQLALSDESRYRFAGPVLQASYVGSIFRWALILPFLAAWQILFDCVGHIRRNDIDQFRQLLMAAAALSLVAFIRSPLGFDRYVTCFLPLWWIALWPEIRRYPVAMGLSFVPLTIQAGLLVEKVMSMKLVFGSPLPHLAGF
ncbi:hypothetical protein GC170_22600 [bacterium]|nr:hypothetical protein [bacterium]